jgi:cyclic pyranopterin phosphate synthase
MAEAVRDLRARPLTDLRVSVTDRCNFRCTYCMPRGVFGPDFAFLPRSELLTFEEITRIVGVFTGLGVDKVRLTGGEPLVRAQLEDLVAMLSTLPRVRELALTTNGSLLTRDKARRLKDSGLTRVTISLDALDDEIFRRMNGVAFPVRRVLEAIETALAVGLTPVKVNAVVQRGVNDQEIVPLAEYFRGTSVVVRFIEYMDVGTANGWRLADVVPAQEIVATIAARYPLEPLEPSRPGEVARRYAYRDGRGEIGVIASVTQPFCGACSRARLSAEGRLYTCLFQAHGHDLRELVRGGASDEELQEAISAVWRRRRDRYSELRTKATERRQKVEMFRIGG